MGFPPPSLGLASGDMISWGKVKAILKIPVSLMYYLFVANHVSKSCFFHISTGKSSNAPHGYWLHLHKSSRIVDGQGSSYKICIKSSRIDGEMGSRHDISNKSSAMLYNIFFFHLNYVCNIGFSWNEICHVAMTLLYTEHKFIVD